MSADISDSQLQTLCAALGWQGGTYWQVVDEVRRLKAQPADSAMEDAMDDAMLAVVLAARDLDALIESGFGPVSRESASLHCALAAFDALQQDKP